MSPISIRMAAETDAEAISQLSDELGYKTTVDAVRERIRHLRNSSTDLLIVAVDSSDRPLGWLQAQAATILESGYRVEVLGLIVSSQVRRYGIGRALMANAEAWAETLSADAVIVRSNSVRTESHTFYPALGYQITKTQHVYRKTLPSSVAESSSSP